MTQEEKKKLLLKDLSARLPYEVICKITANDNPYIGDHKLSTYWLDKVTDICYEIKPYLRPLSSMTEEEEKEYTSIDNRSYSCPQDYAHIPATNRIDWLNAHHFDYRGLIEKNLALEAPDGIYKNKN